jgi:6-phosphogluconolactonase
VEAAVSVAPPAVERFATPEALAERGAELFADAAAEAVAARGTFRVALAGGRTPTLLHQILAEPPWCDLIPWRQTHVFFGDERCVHECSPERNDLVAREALFSVVSLPPGNVHRIDTARRDGAEAYEAAIRDCFSASAGEIPSFDLVFLGLGPDGHTASLFPGFPGLDEASRLVVRVSGAPKPPPDRITMTLPLIDRSRLVVFLATGSEKTDVVSRAVAGDRTIPAGRVAPSLGRVVWLLDEEAAAGLRST